MHIFSGSYMFFLNLEYLFLECCHVTCTRYHILRYQHHCLYFPCISLFPLCPHFVLNRKLLYLSAAQLQNLSTTREHQTAMKRQKIFQILKRKKKKGSMFFVS